MARTWCRRRLDLWFVLTHYTHFYSSSCWFSRRNFSTPESFFSIYQSSDWMKLATRRFACRPANFFFFFKFPCLLLFANYETGSPLISPVVPETILPSGTDSCWAHRESARLNYFRLLWNARHEWKTVWSWTRFRCKLLTCDCGPLLSSLRLRSCRKWARLSEQIVGRVWKNEKFWFNSLGETSAFVT